MKDEKQTRQSLAQSFKEKLMHGEEYQEMLAKIDFINNFESDPEKYFNLIKDE